MFGLAKRTVAMGAAAGLVGVVGSALAASPALAYHINYGTNGTGGAVPLNTPYTTTGSNPFSLTSSAGTAVVQCTVSALGGRTSSAGGSISNELAASSGSLSGCKVSATSQTVSVTFGFSSPWVFQPAGGGPTAFSLTVANVSIKVACGSSSETFAGTLSSGVTWVNGDPSEISFSKAGPLDEAMYTGSGCGLPGPYYITETYPFSTINGSAVSAANNFWLFEN